MELRDAPRIGLGRTAEVYAWGEGRALKLFHPWVPAPSVENEVRCTAVAHAAGLPVPAVLGLETVDGRRGVILERVDGPSLLSLLVARPWRALGAARLLAEVQTAIHGKRVAGAGLTSVRERLRGGIAACGLPEHLQRSALAALERLPDGDVLCHGDLHPDNVILARRGPVVIDWMAAGVGHRLADVARTSLLLRIGAGPVVRPGPLLSRLRAIPHAAYLRRVLRMAGARPGALAGWELVVSVARASEAIEEERPALLALVERLAA